NVVTWTATDVHGNTATSAQRIVVTDQQPPYLATNADLTATTALNLCTTNVPLTKPFASDNCGLTSVVSNAFTLYGNSFGPGTNVVTWTVTDVHGNTASSAQRIIVTDQQPPFIATQTNVVVVADLGVCATTNVALFAPFASDNCALAGV